jgi:uncharacterized protein
MTRAEPPQSVETSERQSTDAAFVARMVTSIEEIGREDWSRCAKACNDASQPFTSYDFLFSLECSGSVGPIETGWLVRHIAIEDTTTGTTIACLPCYGKLHSRGEFVFDHAWSDAYHRAGGNYYPKLQVAVPFTPVPGPRLLVDPSLARKQAYGIIAETLQQACRAADMSSVHITFCDEQTCEALSAQGFLTRIDQQFHWPNNGYTTFEDFLQTLSSRKRKSIRRERKSIQDSGLTFRHLRGDAIKDSDWDAFFDFYINTSDRKWGDPYLTRPFFTELGQRLSENCLLMFADDDGQPVASALHLIDANCLYGRYWGTTVDVPYLHFELCYYQAIDYAITNTLSRVEAGAQGEHKLLRGYLPRKTFSAHWFRDQRLQSAVSQFLDVERRDVTRVSDVLTSFAPYKKS